MIHRGMYREVHHSYSLRKFLKHTAQGLITLLRREEEEMLSSKNIIHLRDRGYIKIPHTTPEEAQERAEDLEELFG